MSNPYFPHDHFWIIGGSTTEVYGSRLNIMVPVGDADYQAWLTQPLDGGPLNTPANVADVEALRTVLAPHGLFPEWLMVAQPTFIQPAEDQYTKEQLKEYSADKRWREELTGIMVLGYAVATDRKSQGMTSAARDFANETPAATSIRFKIADGTFVTFTSAQMVEVSKAVNAHVQACFGIEAATATAIDDGTVTTLDQVDLAYDPIVQRDGRKDFDKLRRWRQPRD